MAKIDQMAEVGAKPMARNRNDYQKSQPAGTSSTPVVPQVAQDSIDAFPEITVDYTKTPDGKELKQHRQCPICWGASKGFGTAYSTASSGKTYYKCDQSLTEQSPCGHTWTVSLVATKIVIEYKAGKQTGINPD